ncbi:MAG TPA: hypothetical protein VIK13_03445 [Candidatus Limnocylindrales bacterium]
MIVSDDMRAVGRPAGLARAGRRAAAGVADVAGLADLVELLGGESPRSRRFLGGLVVGALVGAALAGGSLVGRRRRPLGG